MTPTDHTAAAPRPGPSAGPGDAVEHRLNGKPLAECSLDELSAEMSAGYMAEAVGDGFTQAHSDRLAAVEAAMDAKPEAEQREFEKRMERLS